MPLPDPMENEQVEEFIERCLGDETMMKEYEDINQRFAVCMEQWEGSSEEPVEEIE
jgi:hypothetical protein